MQFDDFYAEAGFSEYLERACGAGRLGPNQSDTKRVCTDSLWRHMAHTI